MNKYNKKQIASSTIHRRGGAKKSLGQNFLKSIPALNKIVEKGEVCKDDIILEIGPGKGALTKKLLGKAGKVIAVEKDNDLVALLKEKFEKEISIGSLVLVHGDILEFDIKNNKLDSCHHKIIANIPYNITGAILKKFLTASDQPKLMVLMVQHEVAKRIVANNNKESILSVSVKAYGEPKLIMKVPARYFQPTPKVDSAIILIKNISRKVFESKNVDENRFWQIVHAGFAHKRKVLLGNLKKLDKKTNWTEVFKLKGIKDNIRAEDLSVNDWLELAKS